MSGRRPAPRATVVAVSEHIVGELRLRSFSSLDRLAPPPASVEASGRLRVESSRPAVGAPVQPRPRVRSWTDRQL
jgi:hypothetical protein